MEEWDYRSYLPGLWIKTYHKELNGAVFNYNKNLLEKN
jgi:hypothetical protein